MTSGGCQEKKSKKEKREKGSKRKGADKAAAGGKVRTWRGLSGAQCWAKPPKGIGMHRGDGFDSTVACLE